MHEIDGVSVPVEEACAVSVSQLSSARPRTGDAESGLWLQRLRSEGVDREQALGDLRELLLKAARFEVHRRVSDLSYLRGGDYEDLAQQSADDALLAILSKLESFRGESRFTTWAYKFALLEAGTKLRRRAWQGREVSIEAEQWTLIADRASTPDVDAESGELMRAIQVAIEQELTPHQREILIACTLNGVPIDVLAERLNTTRGALYKTLHDARRKLRTVLAGQGLPIETI